MSSKYTLADLHALYHIIIILMISCCIYDIYIVLYYHIFNVNK